MSAWRMAFRVGKSGDEMWPACRQLSVAAIQYDPANDIDFSRYPEGEPKAAWSQLEPSQKASLKRLVYQMQKEDVIYVKQGPTIVGKGVVNGPYTFDKNGRIQDPSGRSWQHQRPVRWSAGFPEVRMQLGRSQQLTVEALTNEDVRRIEQEASKNGFASQLSSRFADESDIEGLKSELLTTKTKRSRRLRNKAFDAAKGFCAVCRRDFTKLLSGRGIRVLQVHHREQLAARDSPAVTNLADLVVVCANCHLLLHLNAQKTLSVDELRTLLKNDGYLDGE